MKRWLALTVLCACGGVDREVAEDRVRKIAEGSLGTEVSAVHCPPAQNHKGVAFDCEVEFAEGGTATMHLVITDQFGNFDPSWVGTVLSRKQLAPAVGEQIGESVDCGLGVFEAPATLQCTRAGGAPLAVTVDDHGNVIW